MENVISLENAKNEFYAIACKNMRPKPELETFEKEYEAVLTAMQEGRLIFTEDGTPVLTLSEPIKNTDGEITLSELKFKTRVKPTDRANIAKGIDLKHDAANFSLAITAHIIGQPKVMLDKFGKDDLWVIENLAPVFL